MADEEPENMTKICESRLAGFLIWSPSVAVKKSLCSEMNWVLSEERLSQYSYQLPLSAASALQCWQQ